MKILVTGATGFIGRRLSKELLSRGHELYIVTRPQSRNSCLEIFGESQGVTYIEGDIEDTDVLLDISTVSKHIDEIECVLHMAALYDLTAGLADSYMKNVLGTQNIVGLLKKMKSVKAFHFFSTYAVNPLLKGIITEDQLTNDEYSFPDDYTRTKNEAEHIVRSRTPEHIQVIIHRPGVVIGDSRTGELDKINGPYYFFEFIRKLKMMGPVGKHVPAIPMPLEPDSLLPVIPVDVLVKWSAAIIDSPPKERMRCYHLVSQEMIPTKDFLEEGMKQIGLHARLIPIKYKNLFPPLFPLLKMPVEIIFYMRQAVVFDRTHLNQDYPQLQAEEFRSYLPQIIKGYLGARI